MCVCECCMCMSSRHSEWLQIDEMDVNFIIHNILLRFRAKPSFLGFLSVSVRLYGYTQAKAISHDDKIFPFIFHRWNTRSQCTYETIKEPYVLGRFPSIVNRFVLLRAVSHIESIHQCQTIGSRCQHPSNWKMFFAWFNRIFMREWENGEMTKKYRNIVYHNVIDKLCLFFVFWQFSKEKIND